MTALRTNRVPRAAWLVLAAAALAGACIVYVPVEDQGGYSRPSSYDRYGDRYDASIFYDDLAPYGEWTDLAPYGYVWVPREAFSFGWRPYTWGRWIWTDMGWMFTSPDPWGWAAYHYGRWGFDPRFGWFWVPGTVWAPAWVAWRWGGNAIGWAPLPPGFDFGPGGFYDFNELDIPDDDWVFIDVDRFSGPDVNRWILPRERARWAFRTTLTRSQLQSRGGRVENFGVDPEFVRSRTGAGPELHRIEDAGRPGDARVESGRVVVFRRSLDNPASDVRPRRVLDPADVERDAEKTRTRVRELPRGSEKVESMEEVHERERQVLRRSQEEETKRLKARTEEEKKASVSPRDLKKAGQDAAVKASELKKSQDEEKADLEKRQQQEKKEASEGRVIKKKKI